MEEVARAGEELVGFGPSFDGARFAAAGAVGDFGRGDGVEESKRRKGSGEYSCNPR